LLDTELKNYGEGTEGNKILKDLIQQIRHNDWNTPISITTTSIPTRRSSIHSLLNDDS